MKKIIFVLLSVLSLSAFGQGDINKVGNVVGVQGHLLPPLSTGQTYYWNGGGWSAGLQIGLNVQAWSIKLDNFGALANGSGYLLNDGSGNYTWGAISQSLSGLSDVLFSSLSNGQFIKYNSGTNKWNNYTLVSTDITTALGFTPYNSTNPSNYISLAALSGTLPITYNSGTGAIGINTASGSTTGALSSTDWNTFNNKLNNPSFTNGSIPYWNSGLAQDNSNLFYDFTNHFLGIGTNTPASSLHVYSNSTATNRGIILENYSNSGKGAKLYFRKSRNNAVITSGDTISHLTFAGYDGTNFINAADIMGISTGSVSTGIVPGQISFRTANASGTLTNALLIDKDQSSTFSGTVKVNNINSINSGFTFTTASRTGTNVSGYTSSFYNSLGTGNATPPAFQIYGSYTTSSGSTAQTYTSNPIMLGTIGTTGTPFNYITLWGTPGGQTTTNYDILGNSTALYLGGRTSVVLATNTTVTTSSITTGANIVTSSVNGIQCPIYYGPSGYSNALTLSGNPANGTNSVAGDAVIEAGQSTGNAASASIIGKVSIAGSSGSTLQSYGNIFKANIANGCTFYALTTSQDVLTLTNITGATTNNLLKFVNPSGTTTVYNDYNGAPHFNGVLHYYKSGANQAVGTVTLSSGSGSFTNSLVTASSIIFFTNASPSGTVNTPYSYSISGTTVTVTGGAGDNSTLTYRIDSTY